MTQKKHLKSLLREAGFECKYSGKDGVMYIQRIKPGVKWTTELASNLHYYNQPYKLIDTDDGGHLIDLKTGKRKRHQPVPKPATARR